MCVLSLSREDDKGNNERRGMRAGLGPEDGGEGGLEGEKSWAASGQEGSEAKKGKERARKERVRD
jgi:hypothetical protein